MAGCQNNHFYIVDYNEHFGREMVNPRGMRGGHNPMVHVSLAGCLGRTLIMASPFFCLIIC